ncbi:MAG: MEDS domain-containing protein [Bacteroidales bacterium]|nr:MEDS domain-containing protein [Bacteroidales bacterium]MCF8336551.1 MEDS domain-containing protein [Bacteroidales bacterium]
MHIQTSNQEKLNLGFGGYTCNWGLHIAGLYETAEERDEILFGFLHQGDIEGDLQLYCPVERTKENFVADYGMFYPDCKDHPHDPNLFSIDSAKDFYYPDGTFSPISMDLGLNAFFEKSQKNGPRNIRATAEMVWALEAIPGREHLMAYESRLNYFIPGKPWISVCLYNITKFSGKTIMNVLRTHPYTISGGVITQNPYFVDPDEWLRENATEFAIK